MKEYSQTWFCVNHLKNKRGYNFCRECTLLYSLERNIANIQYVIKYLIGEQK